MDKLEIVEQESKTNMLSTEPARHDDIPPNKCIWPISHGSRKGKPCEANAFDGNIYCAAHQIAITRKEVKEGKQPIVAHRSEFYRASEIKEPPPIQILTPDQILQHVNAQRQPSFDPLAKDMELLSRIRNLEEELDNYKNSPQVEHIRYNRNPNPHIPDLLIIFKHLSKAIANLTDIIQD